MMKFSATVVLFLSAALSVCKANIHSWGQRMPYQDHHMYERTLIDDRNSVPKDYTIFYKYYGAHLKPVAYIEIGVNIGSTGYIHMNRETQELFFKWRDDIQTFDARVYIKNALNVTATLNIRGMGMLPPLTYTGLRETDLTKSLTYVHVKNSNTSSTKKGFAQNSIGKRRDGDKLIHFESRNVTNQCRFPSRAFEYSDGEYITYVGFSFNSSTAMVMIDTKFVGEKEFNAVVYDMNSEEFVANMSVYGIKSLTRPKNFLGVI